MEIAALEVARLLVFGFVVTLIPVSIYMVGGITGDIRVRGIVLRLWGFVGLSSCVIAAVLGSLGPDFDLVRAPIAACGACVALVAHRFHWRIVPKSLVVSPRR